MLHRKSKRYTVSRNGDHYEVLDADAGGARVYFSDSHKAAREISRQLNRGQDDVQKPPDPLQGAAASEEGPG